MTIYLTRWDLITGKKIWVIMDDRVFYKYPKSIIRLKIMKVGPGLFFLYYIINIWNFGYIPNSMRPSYSQKKMVIVGDRIFYKYPNWIIRLKIMKVGPGLFSLYYIIKMWNFGYIPNSMRPSYWQKNMGHHGWSDLLQIPKFNHKA